MICRRQYSTVCAAAQPLRSIRRLGNAGTGGCHATALAGECEVRNARCERHSRHHPPSRRNVSRRCFRQPSHTEQNRTHGIFRLQPPRATERERERETAGERKSGRNSCAARREHKGKESALALRSYPVLPFHALFCAPAVSLARNSCIASRQISIICQTALTLEVPRALSLSLFRWKAETSCRCLWIFQQQELRIIIRNFNSNSVAIYREFDSIRFHCQIIGICFLQN